MLLEQAAALSRNRCAARCGERQRSHSICARARRPGAPGPLSKRAPRVARSAAAVVHDSMPPHLHVLGAGSIGCLFAHHLSAAGWPVTLLLRRAAADAFTAAGGAVRCGGAEARCDAEVLPGPGPASPAGGRGASHIRHLLLATKVRPSLVAAQASGCTCSCATFILRAKGRLVASIGSLVPCAAAMLAGAAARARAC